MIRACLVVFCLVTTTQAQAVVEFRPLDDLKVAVRGPLIDRQNQYTFLGGAVLFTVARQLDAKVRDDFAYGRQLGGTHVIGNEIIGTGVPGGLIGVGFWVWGHNHDDDHMVHAGQAMLETLAASALTTSTLKFVIGRERPDSSDRYSFPSGHTNTVFSSAQVLQEFYGWKLGAPAYFLGAFTAASRIQENRHWLSDTVGGATLGIIVGHAISRAHLLRAGEKTVAVWSITPWITSDANGFLLARRW